MLSKRYYQGSNFRDQAPILPPKGKDQSNLSACTVVIIQRQGWNSIPVQLVQAL